jgi:PAS domain S-box-containing protein
MSTLSRKLALHGALWYLAASACWVVFSDEIAFALARELENQRLIQTGKELAFVLLVGSLLYWFLARRKSAEAVCGFDSARDEERARRALLATPVVGRLGSWRLDLRSRRIWWSDTLFDLAGIAPADFRDHFDFLGDFVPPEDMARLDRQCRRAIESGEPMALLCRVVTPLGATRYFEVSSSVERDEDGRPESVVGSARDVTDHWNTRAQLRSCRRQLAEWRHGEATPAVADPHAKRQPARSGGGGLPRRLAVESCLLQARFKDELSVVLQPRWSISTKRTTGAEALVRWHSAQLGTVSPHEFIPIAEQHAVILQLGRWVVTEVTDMIARHQKQFPELQVSVNLSARQLEDPGFIRFLSQTVERAGIAPSSLEFELTETSLVQNQDACCGFLQSLRGLGFSVALDDFGAGYSSLAYLTQFPVDVVKLDRCFVEQLPDNGTACVVASSVLELANRLQVLTVAEGVENESQRRVLEQAGCHQAQGWLVSPAVPADQFFGQLALEASRHA